MKRRNVKGVRGAAAVLVLLACATFSRACPCTGDDAPCACGPACGCGFVSTAADAYAAPDAAGWQKCLSGDYVGWSFRKTAWWTDTGEPTNGLWRNDTTGEMVSQWPAPVFFAAPASFGNFGGFTAGCST